MRVPILLASLAVLGTGCAAPQDIQVQVLVVNETDLPMHVTLKVWDHDGAQVFTFDGDVAANAPPGADAGTLAGHAPKYGALYTWFAQGGDASKQSDWDPVGVQSWAIHANEDGVEFVFCTTPECEPSSRRIPG